MHDENEVAQVTLEEQNIATSAFVKSSLEAILALHHEIISSKEAMIEQLMQENSFLQETLKSVQALYEEDRMTIGLLSKQIASLQEELEFTKRKYKMMWDKAVENYKK